MDRTFVHTRLAPTCSSIRSIVEAVFSGQEPDGGIFVAGRIEADGSGEIQIDPIGQYPLFYWQRGRAFAVSNNPRLIEGAVQGSSLSLTRSPAPAIDNFLSGGPIAGETLFDEVRSLLLGQSARFGARGLEIVDRYEEVTRAEWSSDVDELTARAVSAFRRHAESVRAAQPNAIAVCDVTGGSDSRTVLALLTSPPVFPELTGRCITHYPNPDANVAGLLMETLGLEPGPFPRTAVDVVKGQKLAIRESAYLHGGARDAERFLPVAVGDLVHFTGSFGELGGATVIPDFTAVIDAAAADRFRSAADFIAAHYVRTQNARLVTAAAIDGFGERMAKELEYLEAAGVQPHDMKYELYLRARCRSHFGLKNYFANKVDVQPDLLASARLLELRRALPPHLYNANKALFGIIMQVRPDLAFLPMLKKWDERIIPERNRDEWAAMRSVDAGTENLSSRDGLLFEPVIAVVDTHDSRDESERAPVRGAPPQRAWRSTGRLAALIPGNQAVLADALDAAPRSHHVWEHYERAAVEEIVRRDPDEFKIGMQVKAPARAAMGIAWLLGMELPYQISGDKSIHQIIEDDEVLRAATAAELREGARSEGEREADSSRAP
jgi:hypothetical protein